MKKRFCLECNREFDFRACPTDVRSGRGKYCSVNCRIKSTTKKIKIYCKICKKEIYPRRRLAQTYCSRKCLDYSAKGRKLSIETRLKISKAHKGKIPKNFGKEFQYKGEKNCKWKGGVTTENEKLRKSERYKQWRLSVMQRDYFTCQHCGQVGGSLQVDHIKPFSLFPSLRLEMTNGRTLCKQCHIKTDTYLVKPKKSMYEK